MNVNFNDAHFYDIERQDGLFYITLRAIYVGSPSEGTKLRLFWTPEHI
uniref:Uncharacterized protein n=1 Tax=uncultured bacterium contig00025 TaxID=1181514 RepID=A0A806KR27_9BACT|nr:hypothetical protein [uncultured bacterium contig00025]